MVREYKDSQLIDRVKKISGFKTIPANYWLLAVRSKDDQFNTFDDKVYLFKGTKCDLVTTCTTNPGGPSLLGGWKRWGNGGAAVIKADEWYYDVYKFGYHNSKMQALRQNANMKYYRDNNNDKKVDELGTIEVDNYYTNFHFNSYRVFDRIKNSIATLIGDWSHGCVVCNDETKYEDIIFKTKFQPGTTMCLIKEF